MKRDEGRRRKEDGRRWRRKTRRTRRGRGREELGGKEEEGGGREGREEGRRRTRRRKRGDEEKEDEMERLGPKPLCIMQKACNTWKMLDDKQEYPCFVFTEVCVGILLLRLPKAWSEVVTSCKRIVKLGRCLAFSQNMLFFTNVSVGILRVRLPTAWSEAVTNLAKAW